MSALSWERTEDINVARYKLLSAAMSLLAANLDEPMITHPDEVAVVDKYAREFVKLLDAPEVCHACGQAVPCAASRANG